ncbi:palmitoyltransferase swf1 [Curvularia kusanoi]|uniref:Palmitoyltransferase swf1 n=1 Tax=Curvularia kusanoi TaxID=90978 RepID=A0A9P4W6Y6_CURKU|nr:palmitoyltransferase swf1 [Curvularia kusanoi]
MPGELTKKEAQAQQVQQQSAAQGARDVETQEHHAKASASGGLNLNIFGALSGALSSKSKKTTHTNADGSSTSVEDRHDQGIFTPPHPNPFPMVFYQGGPQREHWFGDENNWLRTIS